jgi:hypothetical protein
MYAGAGRSSVAAANSDYALLDRPDLLISVCAARPGSLKTRAVPIRIPPNRPRTVTLTGPAKKRVLTLLRTHTTQICISRYAQSGQRKCVASLVPHLAPRPDCNQTG